MKNNTRFSICLLFLWMSMSFCLAAETYSQETFFTIESNNLTVKEVFNAEFNLQMQQNSD